MLRGIFFSMLLLGLSWSPSLAASSEITGDCAPVVNAITARVDDENLRAMEIFDSMVAPSTERSVFDECLRGIVVKDNISLGLPSIGDLFDQLCDLANESIGDQLRGLQDSYKYNPLPGFSVEGGGSVRQTGRGRGVEYKEDVRVRSNSRARAREVLDAIKEY